MLKIRRVREEHTFILVVNKDIILLSHYFRSNKSKQPSEAAGLLIFVIQLDTPDKKGYSRSFRFLRSNDMIFLIPQGGTKRSLSTRSQFGSHLFVLETHSPPFVMLEWWVADFFLSAFFHNIMVWNSCITFCT